MIFHLFCFFVSESAEICLTFPFSAMTTCQYLFLVKLEPCLFTVDEIFLQILKVGICFKSHFGPWVYPMGLIVIALFCPSVNPSLNIIFFSNFLHEFRHH